MRTSLYSILCIVVRVGAILLLVKTMVGLPLALSSVRGGQFGPGAQDMVIGFTGALVALASALWLYPGLLARLASTQRSREIFESPISAAQLQYVAFAVLGVAFAMDALLDLVAFGMRAALTFGLHDPAYEGLRLEDRARVGAQVAKLVLGIALAAGSRGLVGLLRGLRENGLPQALAADLEEDVDSVKLK
ncbi:MAG: hypothetical protein ABI748_08895 [Dokdonella sp.]